MLSEKINDVRVELHEEIAEVNEYLSEDISDFRAESHEDTGYLRADVRGIDTKMDGFIDSHRREHDILYGSAKKDEEDSTSAN